ncbi:MAG: hypothetical protein MMC23_007261 [Stictis urceolatum]|nr:hypothetical protein [Stictis urceolata]
MDKSSRACWPIFTNGPTKADSPYIKSNDRKLVCHHDISDEARNRWLPFAIGGPTSQCVLGDHDSQIKEEDSYLTLYVRPSIISFVVEIRRATVTKTEKQGRCFVPWFWGSSPRTPDLFELNNSWVSELKLPLRHDMESFECHTARQSYKVRVMSKIPLNEPTFSALAP